MRTPLILPLIALSLLTFHSPTARADGVIVERFQPAATSGGYITTEQPETAGHLRLSAGLLTSYENEPLRVVSGPFSSALIDHNVFAAVTASLGLWRFLEVGVSVPVTLYQGGPGVTGPVAMGDIRLHAKGRLLSTRHLSLGLLGTFYLPTGDPQYSGTGMVAFLPRLLGEARVRWFRVGLNVGVLLRQPGQLGDLNVSHELNYSLGVGLQPHRLVELLGEIYGSTALLSPWQSADQSPLEAVGGVALHLGPMTLSAGSGAGIVSGYGAPAWRVFLGLRYQQRRPPPPPAPVQPAVVVTATPPPRLLPPMELAPAEGPAEQPTEYRGNAEVTVTDSELIPKERIYFEVNKVRIRRNFQAVLDALAAVLNEHPELGKIRIEGHADATGTAEYNQELSRHRAESVRDALIERKVPAERLEIAGYGATRPEADNDNAEGRTKNRRVVFYHDGHDGHDGGKAAETASRQSVPF